VLLSVGPVQRKALDRPVLKLGVSMKKVGKENRFLQILLDGKTVSRRMAKVRYRLGNPSATVLRIQEAGYELKRQYVRTSKRIAGKRHITRTVKYSISM